MSDIVVVGLDLMEGFPFDFVTSEEDMSDEELKLVCGGNVVNWIESLPSDAIAAVSNLLFNTVE